MQLLELFCELAVRTGEVVIVDLELALVGLELALDFTDEFLISALSVFELRLGAVVDSLALFEDLLVEIEFLFVEAVDSLHVFHALLENLHFLLQLDLLVSLVVSVFRTNLLQFLGLVFFVVVALLLVVFFSLLVSVEQELNFVGIALEERFALVPELLLNAVQLGGVRVAHEHELHLHFLDEVVDVAGHVLHLVDVVFVLLVQGLHKFVGQDSLILDNLLASSNLNLDVLNSKGLAGIKIITSDNSLQSSFSSSSCQFQSISTFFL